MEGCNLKLQEGIKEHKIKITAACGQQVSEGLKLIFPYIVYQNSRFWNKKAHLPTILVMVFVFIFSCYLKSKKTNKQEAAWSRD